MTSLDLMVASYTGTSTGEEVQIICDCCNQVKLEKTLYSCLQCIDVDLCKECYTAGTPFGSHRRTHTCVWQRAGTSSFTCSCGERHIIRTLFEEHLKSERHQNWVNGVTSGNTGTDNNSTNQDSTDSHVSSSPSNNYSPSSPSSYTPTTPSTPSGEMTSRSRTADLLGTYLPSNQSSAVPSTSSYSTLSRASSYLDPPQHLLILGEIAITAKTLSDQVYPRRDMAQQTMTQQQAVATDTILIHIAQLDRRDMGTILRPLLTPRGIHVIQAVPVSPQQKRHHDQLEH